MLLVSLACSDSGTNVEGELAPEIPNLSEGIPEFDFFKGKVKSSIEQATEENFVIASSLTAAVEAIMVGFSTLPTSFTASAEGVSASFNNGVWEWSYTSAGAGASVTIRLTAEVKVAQTDWAMYLSASNGEISFDNYKFIDGLVKNTSNGGEWNFYEFEEESSIPVMSYTWDIESETDATFTVTFGESSFSSLTYIKDLPDNTLTITDEASSSSVIYWNSDTGTGYVETSGQDQICWDANGDNVACPS
ncbi:MAG: hypothetical protein BalsKO_00520 [Balneolaceae bacterium]